MHGANKSSGGSSLRAGAVAGVVAVAVLAACGSMAGKTELHADVLQGARVIVEYEPQSRIEGDTQQLPDDFPVTELWRVPAGLAAGRESVDQVTVFDSVGSALEDYSALRYVYALAQEYGAGEDVLLVPPAGNPIDSAQRNRNF